MNRLHTRRFRQPTLLIVGLLTESLFRLVQYMTTQKWGTESY